MAAAPQNRNTAGSHHRGNVLAAVLAIAAMAVTAVMSRSPLALLAEPAAYLVPLGLLVAGALVLRTRVVGWLRVRGRALPRVRRSRYLARCAGDLAAGDPAARDLSVARSGDAARALWYAGRGERVRGLAATEMRTELPGHLLFRPADAEQVRQFCARAPRSRRYLLWLDEPDLDQVAGYLNDLLSDPGAEVTVVVLGTGDEPAPGTPAGTGEWPGSRQVAEFLARADVVDLREPEPAGAAGTAGSAGPAGTAGAGLDSALTQRYEKAGAEDPVAGAVLAAAIDCQRAGLATVTEPLLHEICGHYLPGAPTVPRRAFARALRRVRHRVRGVALLHRAGGGRWRADARLVPLRREIPVPSSMWRPILREVSGRDALAVGHAARAMSLYRPAVTAFAKAEAAGLREAEYPHGLVLGESGRLGPAIARLSELLRRDADRLEPASLVRYQVALADFLGESGRTGKAVVLLESLLADIPAGDGNELLVQHRIARWRCEQGQVTASLHQLHHLARRYQHEHPQDERGLLDVQHTIASWTAGTAGGAARAGELLTELIGGYHRLHLDNQPECLAAQRELARLRGAHGEPARAQADLRELVERAAQQWGRAHPQTLYARTDWAVALAAAGDLPSAGDEFDRLVADCEGALGEFHRHTLAARHQRAVTMSQRLARQAQAVEELEAVVALYQNTLDADHPQVLRARRDLACVRGHREPERARADLAQILAVQREVLDASHPDIDRGEATLRCWKQAAQVHIGRQPIHDLAGAVAGYELLFRDSAQAASARWRDSTATSQVIINTFTVFGVADLVGTLPCFINVTREFLVGSLPLPVDPELIVLDVVDSVYVDAEVAAGVRRLAELGYRVALNSTDWSPVHEELLPHLAYVRLDLHQSSQAQINAIAATCRQRGEPGRPALIGHRIETPEQWSLARAVGCTLFQGLAVGREQTFSKPALSSSWQLRARLFELVVDSEADIATVVAVVKSDPELSATVVRLAGSASMGRLSPVSSVEEAVVNLGLDQVGHIAMVLSVAGLSHGDTGQVALMVERCRFGELIATRLGGSAPKAYLACLQVEIADFFGSPVRDIVTQYPVSEEISAAVLERTGVLGEALDIVAAYLHGDTSTARDRATVPDPCLTYLRSVSYATTVTRGL